MAGSEPWMRLVPNSRIVKVMRRGRSRELHLYANLEFPVHGEGGEWRWWTYLEAAFIRSGRHYVNGLRALDAGEDWLKRFFRVEQK